MPAAPERQRGTSSGFLTPQRISAGILAVLAVIFMLQNRDDVTLQFLGIQLTATLWFASLALLVAGILIGVLWTSRRTPR